MTQIESMALTSDQIAAMNNPDSDWLKMTPEQREFIESVDPEQVCFFYGDEILRLHKEQLMAIQEVAFKTAYAAALELAGDTILGQTLQCEVEDMELGQTFMRVSVTDEQGRKTSAVGMIPDPRMH